jgi:hypothetical protein
MQLSVVRTSTVPYYLIRQYDKKSKISMTNSPVPTSGELAAIRFQATDRVLAFTAAADRMGIPNAYKMERGRLFDFLVNHALTQASLASDMSVFLPPPTRQQVLEAQQEWETALKSSDAPIKQLLANHRSVVVILAGCLPADLETALQLGAGPIERANAITTGRPGQTQNLRTDYLQPAFEATRLAKEATEAYLAASPEHVTPLAVRNTTMDLPASGAPASTDGSLPAKPVAEK